jgi:hypothetical protein
MARDRVAMLHLQDRNSLQLGILDGWIRMRESSRVTYFVKNSVKVYYSLRPKISTLLEFG